jgi:hypothetical protein
VPAFEGVLLSVLGAGVAGDFVVSEDLPESVPDDESPDDPLSPPELDDFSAPEVPEAVSPLDAFDDPPLRLSVL